MGCYHAGDTTGWIRCGVANLRPPRAPSNATTRISADGRQDRRTDRATIAAMVGRCGLESLQELPLSLHQKRSRECTSFVIPSLPRAANSSSLAIAVHVGKMLPAVHSSSTQPHASRAFQGSDASSCGTLLASNSFLTTKLSGISEL